MHVFKKLLCIFSGIILVNLPVASARAETSSNSGVLINEIQTESIDDANMEFVEIVNSSGTTVVIDDWKLQYRAASGASWSTKSTLAGQIYPGGSIVVSTIGYLQDNSTFHWSGVGGQLASTGGNLRILRSDGATVVDSVAWGNGIYGELAAATRAAKGSSIQRKLANQIVQDTDNNSLDFNFGAPSPQNINILPVVPVVIIPPVLLPEPPPVPDPTPIVVVPDTTPVIVDPPTDISTPIIVVTPPDPTLPVPPVVPPVENHPPVIVVPPVVVDPVLPPTIDPGSTPQTPPAAPPEVQAPLVPFVISELMINPSAPQSDASDEWIELYNPNDRVFVLHGYTLQSGSNHSYSHTFTDQTIEPLGYIVVYSAGSHLALSNSSGGVRAINSTGESYGDSVVYEDVEEGNAYALNSFGAWLWTTSPSPGQANTFTKQIELIPPVKLPATTPKATTKSAPKPVAKVTAPKVATTAKQLASSSTSAAKATTAPKAPTAASKKTTVVKAASTPKSTSSSGSQLAQAQKSRPWVLASFGMLALLYGVYEYRDDLSSTVQKLRRYVKSRRKTRLAMSGR